MSLFTRARGITLSNYSSVNHLTIIEVGDMVDYSVCPSNPSHVIVNPYTRPDRNDLLNVPFRFWFCIPPVRFSLQTRKQYRQRRDRSDSSVRHSRRRTPVLFRRGNTWRVLRTRGRRRNYNRYLSKRHDIGVPNRPRLESHGVTEAPPNIFR